MGIPKDKLAILIGKVKDKHGDEEEDDVSEETSYSTLDCAKKILKAVKADDAQMLADALDELEDTEEEDEDTSEEE